MKKRHDFKVRSIYKRGSRVAVATLHQTSLMISLMVASVLLAFAINSVFAAPSGPPTNPAVNVSPNFDGMTITGGGKIFMKDSGDTFNRIEIDATDGALFLKDGAGSTSMTIDGNTSRFEVAGTGARVDVNGDNGIAQISDNSLTMTTGGTQKVNLSAGAADGSLSIYSAWGITRPYITMIADGTTSLLNLAGGALDAAVLQNTSTASSGNVLVNDNLQIGTSTVERIRLESNTGNIVLNNASGGEEIRFNPVSKLASVGRVVLWDYMAYVTNSAKTAIHAYFYSDNFGGHLVLMNSTGSNDTIRLDGNNRRITMKNNAGSGTMWLYGETGQINLTGNLVARDIYASNNLYTTNNVSVGGNLTATGSIGRFYPVITGWKSISSLASGGQAFVDATCSSGTHKVTGCSARLWGTPNGINYTGAFPSGGGCRAEYKNDSASPQSFWIQGVAYCFDPTTN